MTAPGWSRRSLLGIGAGSLGLVALGLTLRPPAAAAVEVGVGELVFTVPAAVRPMGADPALGAGWQWQGQSLVPGGGAPGTVVLARADVPSTDAEEVLGLVLAGSAAGLLPDLVLTGSRTRAMPGGGQQTRTNLSYTVAAATSPSPARTLHGTLLVAVRSSPPAALLVVLGDGSLTAGTVDAVLESARWRG